MKRLRAPCCTFCPIYDARKIYAHVHIKITGYWTEFNPLESGKGGGTPWETITTSQRRGRYIGKREREKEETPCVSLARARSLFRPLLPSACYAGYPLPIFPRMHLPPQGIFSLDTLKQHDETLRKNKYQTNRLLMYSTIRCQGHARAFSRPSHFLSEMPCERG